MVPKTIVELSFPFSELILAASIREKIDVQISNIRFFLPQLLHFLSAATLARIKAARDVEMCIASYTCVFGFDILDIL